jgi:hypothetical protein
MVNVDPRLPQLAEVRANLSSTDLESTRYVDDGSITGSMDLIFSCSHFLSSFGRDSPTILARPNTTIY